MLGLVPNQISEGGARTVMSCFLCLRSHIFQDSHYAVPSKEILGCFTAVKKKVFSCMSRARSI